MAALLLSGGIALYVGYQYIKTKFEIEEILRSGERVDDDSIGGWNFSRSPKSDLFSPSIDSLALSPDMPIGGTGGTSTIFTQQKKANGIFGIPKRLLKDKNNTLYTVYEGTEHKLFDV